MRKQGVNREMLKSGHYIAYSDGSVFNGGCQSGAGWVIYSIGSAPGDEPLRRGSRRITESSRATTTLAEICAATAALNAIGGNSHITLHVDDADLYTVLRYQSILPERIERHDSRPELQSGYTALFNAVQRHASVTPIKSDADTCPRLRLAHHLAREGAFAKPQGPAPQP